jgi:hypothetical protein
MAGTGCIAASFSLEVHRRRLGFTQTEAIWAIKGGARGLAAVIVGNCSVVFLGIDQL